MKKDRWIYSESEDIFWEYSDEFDSKEEAIESAKDDDEIENNGVYVGKKVEPSISDIDLDLLLENVALNSTIGCEDGVGDDFLMNIKKEHYNELEKSINEIFFNWIKKYGYQPDWFIVENIEYVDLIG